MANIYDSHDFTSGRNPVKLFTFMLHEVLVALSDFSSVYLYLPFYCTHYTSLFHSLLFCEDVLQVLFNSAEGLSTCSSDMVTFELLRFLLDGAIAVLAFDILGSKLCCLTFTCLCLIYYILQVCGVRIP